MKIIRRYNTILLVVVLSFLPAAFRAFPNLSLGKTLLVSGLIAVVAVFLEYYRGVQPYLGLLEKRAYLYSYACDDARADLRQHDPSARMNVMEIDRALPNGWT